VAAVIAAGSAVVAVRVVLRDRQRSAARVAALADAIDDDPLILNQHVDHSVPVAALFESRDSDAGRRSRLALGVVGAMVVIGAVVMWSQRHDPAPQAAAQPAVEQPAAAATASPLELDSMRHERQGNAFEVTGFVRNPAAGSPVDHLTAVVFAFDGHGTYLASGRAAIEFATLEPGDGSPFVVNIPTTAQVARYRVAFRRGDTLVRHLDKRTEAVSLASNRR
jgi:hypothetical protein